MVSPHISVYINPHLEDNSKVLNALMKKHKIFRYNECMKKDCPICGKEQAIKGYWREFNGKPVLYYPNYCSGCFKDYGKNMPEFYNELILENNRLFMREYRNEGDFLQSGDSGFQNFIDIEEIDLPDNNPFPNPETSAEDSEEMEMLRGIIGTPATWTWHDTSTGILYSFSTPNPFADFANLTKEVLGVGIEQAPKERFILHATFFTDVTQQELGDKLGMTQGRVSQILDKILKIIKR